MNDKLLDALFARRKEAVTRSAFCLFVSALLAVAGRIPILFVSLPATWISGGLSIAFIWVIGPPILIVLQAYALHGISEAEQLRVLLRQQSSLDSASSLSAIPQLGDELTPIWRASSPPIIHLALAVAMLAPTVANCALFGSYLQFVRPGNEKSSRASQVLDAFVGKGGWGWFKPIAPSLAGNLKELEDSAIEPDKTKYHNLANEVPWVEFPILTWGYLLLLVISIDGVLVGAASLAGASILEQSVVYWLGRNVPDWVRRLRKRWAKAVATKPVQEPNDEHSEERSLESR
jgi:hypothetical protein